MQPDAQWPSWVGRLIDLYGSGASSFFILNGNVDDIIGSQCDDAFRLESLTDFLAHRLLDRFDLVLHYDIGRGLRIHPAGDGQRESRMKRLLGERWPGVTKLPHEPTPMLRLMDRLVTRLLADAKDGEARSAAFLFDYAELICPQDGRGAEHLATFLNWARNPDIRKHGLLFILMTGSLARIDAALIQSAYTTEIQVPMPDTAQREWLICSAYPERRQEAPRLAAISAGLTLMNLDTLLRQGAEGRTDPASVDGRLSRCRGASAAPAGESPPAQAAASVTAADTWAALARAKKALIEAQCPGLLEFVEPKLSLELVAGHTAAKQRLAEDAELIKAGHLDAVPMGYLICGPVGVGKTFLAMCYAGSVGIPCVSIRNFRSKYVGETEANLERILQVLRELGPVAVIIDEADAAVGNRGQSGDSGTGSRVFAQLAAQMGNTRYRGRTIWFLLTCRPDLLPVDLKRQGRCEEHIPLFYPERDQDRIDMFLAMAKKIGLSLDPKDVPGSTGGTTLSGADIESLLMRAKREARLSGKPLDRDLLERVVAVFRSPRSPEHELQVLAGVMECSDLRYLSPALQEQVAENDAWAALQLRFQELKLRFERF